MKKIFFVLAFIFAAVLANAQQPLSQRMAATAMKLWPDSSAQWSYERGIVLNGVESIWEQTADKQYFIYVQHSMDALIADEGTIKNDRKLDNAMFGRLTLRLFNITEQGKYYKAALQLYGHLKTSGLGQQHHETNPKRHDDLCVAEPFYTDWAHTFHRDSDFNDIAKQFILINGLPPGNSSHSYGLYMMDLVDVLDNFPKSNVNYKKLRAVLSKLSTGIQKYQDAKTGLWHGVMNKSNKPDAHFDTTASCMFMYSFAKSVRKGYLPATYAVIANKGYKSISNGQKPKSITNENIGTFIQANVEMERLDNLWLGKGKTVLLDSYFNNEHHKDITGKTISYHYKWDEMTNNGFSFLGDVFNNYGVKTGTLYDAPTVENLKPANIYIIVDPDIPKENPDTKYIEADHIKAISDWVKAGGVLAVLNNDTGNAEFAHLNKLLLKFGMRFNLDSRNNVKGIQYEQGAIYIPAGNEIFKTAKKIYMKDISTLHVDAPAYSALTDKNDVIIAVAKYGKGTVFAVGDPWFYNEYTDGRKLSPDFQNFKAANDLIKWLIGQIPK